MTVLLYESVTVRFHLGPVCAEPRQTVSTSAFPKEAVKKGKGVAFGVTVLGITVSEAIN